MRAKARATTSRRSDTLTQVQDGVLWTVGATLCVLKAHYGLTASQAKAHKSLNLPAFLANVSSGLLAGTVYTQPQMLALEASFYS